MRCSSYGVSPLLLASPLVSDARREENGVLRLTAFRAIAAPRRALAGSALIPTAAIFAVPVADGVPSAGTAPPAAVSDPVGNDGRSPK